MLGTRESGSAPSGSQAKSSGAVNQQQAARQPDEAMSSGASGWAELASRGDARAGKRARTGGAKTAPGRGQRTSELDSCVLRYLLGVCAPSYSSCNLGV